MTSVTGAVVRGGHIKAAVVENKGGRQAVAADSFIDATGDADLAFHAGAAFDPGVIAFWPGIWPN